MNHFKTLALGTALLLTATVETQAACVPCPTVGVDFSLNCTGSTGCASGPVSDSQSGIWMAQVKPQVKTTTSFNLNGQTAIASALSTMVMCTYNTGSSTVQLLWAPTENPTFSCSINASACPKGILCTSASEKKNIRQ